MINEIVFLSIIFLSGSMLTYVLLQNKYASCALGFIVGSVMQIAIGTILIITGYPVSPVVNVLLVLLVSIICFCFRMKYISFSKIGVTKAIIFVLLSVGFISSCL